MKIDFNDVSKNPAYVFSGEEKGLLRYLRVYSENPFAYGIYSFDKQSKKFCGLMREKKLDGRETFEKVLEKLKKTLGIKETDKNNNFFSFNLINLRNNISINITNLNEDLGYYFLDFFYPLKVKGFHYYSGVGSPIPNKMNCFYFDLYVS